MPAGDIEHHDTIVAQGLTGLCQRSDVVVLAEASMSRVVGKLDVNSRSPILSSPELAVRRMRDVLCAGGKPPKG